MVKSKHSFYGGLEGVGAKEDFGGSGSSNTPFPVLNGLSGVSAFFAVVVVAAAEGVEGAPVGRYGPLVTVYGFKLDAGRGA